MNRNYTADEYRRLVESVRKAIPGISLTTDVIVGFSGETEDDFHETVRLLETVEFNALFAYKYSPREGTVSFTMPDDVSPETKEERLSAILTIANNISTQMNAWLIGTAHEVLIEKKEDKLCTARTGANTKVYFYSDDNGLVPGKFVNVKITECRITTLVGEVCPPRQHLRQSHDGSQEVAVTF
jgi:tRNA-2-methylthio-N6-dimethylallyladenosine synthase